MRVKQKERQTRCPHSLSALHVDLLTHVAAVSDPLDADVVSDLEVGLVVVHGDDVAGAFVTTNESVMLRCLSVVSSRVLSVRAFL